MTPPYLTPSFHPLPAAPEPDADAVALEVRLAHGRPRRYVLEGAEFSVGGDPGCDVRLAGADVPPVVCVVTRTADALYARRADAAFPVLWNERFLPIDAPARLGHGDRVAVGAIDITVHLAGVYLHPDLATPDPAPPATVRPPRPVPFAPPPRPEPPPAYGPDATAQLAEVARQRAELAAQARELEEDRVLWYRRRQELEAEATRPARDPAGMAQREAELAGRRAELEGLRDQLAAQYQERRDQLAQMHAAVAGASADLNSRRERLDREAAELAATRLALDAQHRERVAAVEAEAARFREEFLDAEAGKIEASLLARPDADGRTLPEREAAVAAETDRLRAEREQFAAELVRLERRRTSLDAHEREQSSRAAALQERADALTRDRADFLAQLDLTAAEQQAAILSAAGHDGRAAELDARAAELTALAAKLDAQQATLAVAHAATDRRQAELAAAAEALAADRERIDGAAHDLAERLRAAEQSHALLSGERDDHAGRAARFRERERHLAAAFAEADARHTAADAEAERLHAKEAELDRRSEEFAGQAAELKARAQQLAAMHDKLDADREALQLRAAALAEGDAARASFQDQLRRRADEVAARTKALDEAGQRLAAEQDAILAERERLQHASGSHSTELLAQVGELETRAAWVAEREANVERQATRLREVGRVVAAQKRDFATERQAWDAERASAEERARAALTEYEAFHARAAAEMAALKDEAPALHDRTRAALDRVAAAREGFRGHLGELHAFADASRAELDAARAELRAEAVKIDERERALEAARGEHRLAVTEFRGQVDEWQRTLAEARAEAGEFTERQAEADEAARQLDDATLELARQAEALRAEREMVAGRRSEVETHLSDLREWYRRKLKDLVAGRAAADAEEAEASDNILSLTPRAEEPDPGDRVLGDRLRALDLVDADTLNTLWGEARRQRRTLRTVLLAGGAVTLYQLAMMEAGNLNSLVLGRLRVLDRLRVTPREVVYRVLDPERVGGPTRGVYALRHLAEAEMDDAVRPDEFRQMFTAARDAAHPNLAATAEVLELAGRPAALVEYAAGLPSGDWPVEAAVPGAWVKLLLGAARGLDAAHRHGLTHGRLSSESFVLTPAGDVKVVGVGEPMWLSTGVAAALDPTPEADLRALGQVAYGWSQLGLPAGKRRPRGKGLPESLAAVVRRLEADPETPMADTASGAVPYRTAADLAADLARLAAIFPCPAEAEAALRQAAADNAGPARQSA
jgi:chromosome segregation ATPase